MYSCTLLLCVDNICIDLTVHLKQDTPLNYSNDVLSDDKINTIDENTLETKIRKRRITFSDFHTVISSDPELDLIPNSSVKTIKTSILKKTNSNEHNGGGTKIP